MKNLESWARLAAAAADARDELRAVLPCLDAAIADGQDTTGLLSTARALMGKHADSLRKALKAPAGAAGAAADRARNAAWRSGGLWSVR